MRRALRGFVLVVTLAACPGAAMAAAPASVTAPSGEAPAPGAEASAPPSIPVPQIARRADDVAQQLRELESLRAPDVFQQTVEQRLGGIALRVGAQTQGTNLQLDASPSMATLEGLLVQWQALRAELLADVNVLARRATQLEEALERLTALQQTWNRARADARASRAPAAVLGRIDGVLAALGEMSASLQAQRSAALLLQDRFAREVARCEDTLGRIATVRQTVSGGLLDRDSAPLWDAAELARIGSELPDHLRAAATADIGLMRQFARDQRWKLPLHLAVFLGLMLLMRAARRRAHGGSADPAAVVGPHVFDRYVSAALIVSILAYPFIYSPPFPRVVSGIAMLLALVPALRIMQVLLDPVLAPGLYVLGTFLLTDLVRNFASVIPLLERSIFLLEMFAGTIALSWLWVARRWPRDRPVELMTVQYRVLRLARGVALAAFAAAFVAGVAGYMKLALLLGSGILGNAYLALVLYAGVRVGDGLLNLTLSGRPMRRLGMVQRHSALLERRAHGLLRCVAVAAWLVFALKYFYVWHTAVDLVGATLQAEMRLGSLRVSLGDVLMFASTIIAAFVISALARFALDEEVYPRLNLGRGFPQVSSSLLHYTLVLGGVLVALAALNVDLTKITIVAGALGVGIGFGLQGLVNNFVSGALVLLERKINVGDAVQIGDVTGQVQQLGMRACIVRTWEGAEVIVPNATLTAEKVANWTLSDRRRRIDLAIGVAYGSSPKNVLDVLTAVARAHVRVLQWPAPEVIFREFGESALRFEMRVWTDRFDLWVATQSELAVALHAALDEAGIEIAAPRREVRVRPS